MNRYIPLIVAAGIGVMSGYYIWEPSLRAYQRESKGTWNYEVVQQTRSEELNRHADSVAEATGTATGSQTPTSSTPTLSNTEATSAEAPSTSDKKSPANEKST
ncbi:hypothetical protein BGZ49_010821 [Haplosporangium sp. Z 27]|nr:hypothetical protein BGZ49_010821 [Haplosporangium sp. Z 27]